MSALNSARMGHLFLNEGNWNGQQLDSNVWVERATSVQVPTTIPELPNSYRLDGGVAMDTAAGSMESAAMEPCIILEYLPRCSRRRGTQASIQAYELIANAGRLGAVFADITDLPADGLGRARGNLNPLTLVLELDDAIIATENSVVNMGSYNSDTTSYTHKLDWLVPPANGDYLSGLFKSCGFEATAESLEKSLPQILSV